MVFFTIILSTILQNVLCLLNLHGLKTKVLCFTIVKIITNAKITIIMTLGVKCVDANIVMDDTDTEFTLPLDRTV